MIQDNYIFVGDNLKVMKSNDFKSFYNSVDLIYIDPPYNTGNKFSFEDKNNKWAEDISFRLELARECLNNSGVIYISIDDSELASLLITCYRIFGKDNFGGIFVTKQSLRSNSKQINVIHEYIVCFCKNKKYAPSFYINRLNNPTEASAINNIMKSVKNEFTENGKLAAKKLLGDLIKKYCINNNVTWIRNYSNVDDEGNIYFAKDLSTPGKARKVDIPEINLHLEPLNNRGWSSDSKFISLFKSNRLCFKANRPYEIEYLSESVDNITSILDFYSRHGTNDLKKLGLAGLFDTPKPVEMIKFLIRSTLHHDGIVLDFYAGSGTTAQAVYEINREDKNNHKYVLIQKEEKLNINSDVYKKALEFGIVDPTVDKLMLLRVNKYLEKNGEKADFFLKNIGE